MTSIVSNILVSFFSFFLFFSLFSLRASCPPGSSRCISVRSVSCWLSSRPSSSTTWDVHMQARTAMQGQPRFLPYLFWVF